MINRRSFLTVPVGAPHRAGKKIEWDHEAMRAANATEADPFINRPEYRRGY